MLKVSTAIHNMGAYLGFQKRTTKKVCFEKNKLKNNTVIWNVKERIIEGSIIRRTTIEKFKIK